MQIGTFTIQYDRTTPGWTAVTETDGGNPQRFQTGAVGKQAAIRYALTQAYPTIAQAVIHLVQHCPEASSRAWAAAELLVSRHVQAPGPAAANNCLAWVRSQRAAASPHYYQLYLDGGHLTCDCLDLQQAGVAFAGQLWCKHLLAYQLARHLDWPLGDTAVSLPPRLAAGGHWRGRTVTAVGTGHRAQLVTPDAPPTYANGADVSADHLPAYHAFVTTVRQRPFNAEKLMSWYVGR